MSRSICSNRQNDGCSNVCRWLVCLSSSPLSVRLCLSSTVEHCLGCSNYLDVQSYVRVVETDTDRSPSPSSPHHTTRDKDRQPVDSPLSRRRPVETETDRSPSPRSSHHVSIDGDRQTTPIRLSPSVSPVPCLTWAVSSNQPSPVRLCLSSVSVSRLSVSVSVYLSTSVSVSCLHPSRTCPSSSVLVFRLSIFPSVPVFRSSPSVSQPALAWLSLSVVFRHRQTETGGWRQRRTEVVRLCLSS